MIRNSLFEFNMVCSVKIDIFSTTCSRLSCKKTIYEAVTFNA